MPSTPQTPLTSSYAAQLREEQAVVDACYARLDDLREQARARLQTVRQAGSHGSPTQRTERDSFAMLYEDRLTQLRAVEDRLVFGRLDDVDGKRRYIGRIGLSTKQHEPMLTDWRADAAQAFYEATPAHHGDVAMRRHLTLRFREVASIEDEVLDAEATQVQEAAGAGTLAGEGALLASLNSRRTGKMTDIVATIQAEQDRIIRAPLDQAIVVQGGPGTGKTAVALHRAAYLLYAHRAKLARSGVLLVGPSSTFLHYIDQVLPSLGETGVVSRTLGDLIPGINATVEDEPRAAALKGDARMRAVIARAVAARERIPQLPRISVSGITLQLREDDMRQAQLEAHRTRQPHNIARETFIRSMMGALKRQYLEKLTYTPEADEIADVMLQLRLHDTLRKTLNLAWLPMTGEWLIRQLFAKPHQLRRFAPWLTDDDVALLTRKVDAPWTLADIPLLDEAMELLGPDPHVSERAQAQEANRQEQEQFAKDTLAQAGIGNGIVSANMLLDNMYGAAGDVLAERAGRDRSWTYGHIVVDEAQELSAMAWRMLLRRCPTKSLTIVGDVAQTAALGGTRRWASTMNRLFGKQGWHLRELTINYRNPREVNDVAAKFATSEGLYLSTTQAVRSVPQSVREQRVAEEGLVDAIAQQATELARHYLGDGVGRIAIIAPKRYHEALHQALKRALVAAFGEQWFAQLAEQPTWDRQLLIADTAAVKGLEFDAVIVAQPALIEQLAPSRLSAAADLYVAMTRPTQQLVIVRTDEDASQMPLPLA